MIRINKRVLFLLIMISLFYFISATQAGAQGMDDKSMTLSPNAVWGKTYFTTANIWYERPGKIYSTNYHRGTIIPAGSKVTMKQVTSSKINFDDKNGMQFRIIFVKKHNNRGMDIWAYFNQYFSETDPTRKGGEYGEFTNDEKDNIKIGEIKEGMSKSAVLMAYGYPPSHRTPSLDGGIWIYWTSRYVKKSIYFKNNKILKIVRGG